MDIKFATGNFLSVRFLGDLATVATAFLTTFLLSFSSLEACEIFLVTGLIGMLISG